MNNPNGPSLVTRVRVADLEDIALWVTLDLDDGWTPAMVMRYVKSCGRGQFWCSRLDRWIKLNEPQRVRVEKMAEMLVS